METGSRKKLRIGSQQQHHHNIDRISSLPDDLLIHILSFLDMKEVVQSSLLSSRWRYLWTSVQILNFESSRYVQYMTENFTNFVDMVLSLKSEDNSIQRFRLDNGRMTILPGRLNKWIVVLVQCHIQELHVSWRGRRVKFCRYLFTCQSLVNLDLRINGRRRKRNLSNCYHFILPNSISLPSLKTMHLEDICFVDEKLTNNLFSSCPILESLTITECDVHLLQHLIINAPRLKHLMIKFSYTPWAQNECKIMIHTPNLITFHCGDNIGRDYRLGSCSTLENACINIGYYDEGTGNMEKEYRHRIIRCLRAVCNVKSLALSALYFQILPEPSALFRSPPMQFCNLKYLKLKTWLSEDWILAIMHLLSWAPNIETIFVRIHYRCDQINPYFDEDPNSKSVEKYWETSLLSPYMLENLKSVELRDAKGWVNELEFLEFLLETSSVLEKLVLSTSTPRCDRESTD